MSELKPLIELSLHPSASHIPERPRNTEAFQSFVSDIAARGLVSPLSIDGLNRIVDGRWRYHAVKLLRWDDVPVNVIPDDQVNLTLIQNLLQRRHLTKGQRAYLVYPCLAAGHEEARRLRIEKLKKGQHLSVADSIGSGKTVSEFVAQLGFSRDLFEQAARIHELFARHSNPFDWADERHPLTLREYYEPRILDEEDPCGLGSVLAGIGSKLSPASDKQQRSKQGDLIRAGLYLMQTRFAYWDNITPAEQADIRPMIHAMVQAMPAGLRAEVIKAARDIST